MSSVNGYCPLWKSPAKLGLLNVIKYFAERSYKPKRSPAATFFYIVITKWFFLDTDDIVNKLAAFISTMWR